MPYFDTQAARRELDQLNEAAAGRQLTEEETERWNALAEPLDEIERRREFVRNLHRRGRNGEAGVNYDRQMPRGSVYGDLPELPQAVEARDTGLRTIERCHDSGVMPDRAANAMEALSRDPRDPTALTARYLAAAGDPAYNRAFGKWLMYGHLGDVSLRFSREESAAWQRVQAIEAERAAMQTGSGAAGGYALPIVIDPTIMLTSNGALNPIRQLARVLTTNTTEWRGVSSAGVVASYDAELEEVSDDSPTLDQPVIFTEKGQAFVEFSIEIGQDWGTLQAELLKLVADSKDVLDATVFYSGSGTDEPFGVRTGLTTTQRVLTAGAAAFAYADVYTLKQAIRPRDMATATFAFHPNRVDDIWRFVAAGDTTDAPVMNDDRSAILGRPLVEWTAVPTAVTTGTTVGIYGDFNAAYTIIDRIGLTAELVPHIFGSNRRPQGSRGLYCYWRTGAKTVVPEALRYLETT